MVRKCPCTWGEECARLEHELAVSGNDRYCQGSDGRIRIKYNPNSYKNIALRTLLHHHVGTDPCLQSSNVEYFVARHHFHPNLLDYLLDNKKHAIKTCLTIPLPADVADQVGICGEINMFPAQPSSLGNCSG